MTTPLKLQIIERCTGDATLIALLGDGANSVMPQAGKHPDRDSATPFVVLRMGSESPTDSLARLQEFTFWVYDDPLQAYWVIDKIITRLEVLFSGYEGFAFEDRSWIRCEYAGRSDEETDEDWNKVMKWARFTVPRV